MVFNVFLFIEITSKNKHLNLQVINLNLNYLQSRAKTGETLCLLKRIFRSRTSLFSFTPPPHFNVVAAEKSIGQSNILNIEKGEGGIDRMQCNFIECLNHFARDYSKRYKSI